MNLIKSQVLQLLLFTFLLLSKSFVLATESKICLTMIVRNEEKIIERCLDSIKGTIDCLSICDTGSQDNTVQIIEQYMQKHQIPGKVYRQEWKNFGHNRTLSAQSAKKTIQDLGYCLENTYFLMIDADMLLVKDPAFTKKELKDDCYLVLQKTAGQSYYNARLLRAALPWKCIGVTHEYWSSQTPGSKDSKINSLMIDDQDDGGCKADKFERDIKMLTQGLKEEPDNVRYMFYLAQSYKSLRQYEDSIRYYKQRIAMGGWSEEVWYSKFMIGQCYEDLGLWDQALLSYLDAFQYNPRRAEPLQQISTHYRLQEQYDLSYLFAKQGSQIPYPQDEILFISHPVYEYLFDVDLSISAYYTAHREEGHAVNNKLMLKKNIPQHIKEQAYRNAIVYASNLNAKYTPIKIDLPPIREGLAGHYNPMNPSIRKTDQGYDLICRTVNYIQIGAKHFKSLDLLDPNNTARTRNFFIQYDKDFNILSQKEITENLPRQKNGRTNILGLEDCRMFLMNGSTWFSCTTLDTSPTGLPQVSLGKLSDNRTGPHIEVEKLISLNGPQADRCEKNWLPFIKEGQFHMIYSFEPFVIYKPDLDTKTGIIQQNLFMRFIHSDKYDLSRFSGSASPIEFDDGYLVIVHETIDDGQRTYLHRFLTFDKNFAIQKISKPFIFLHKGIEYTCGMTIDHSKENLIIPIGIEDREAYLCTVNLAMVRSLLEPLP